MTLNSSTRKEVLFLVLCIAAGFIFRFHGFDQKSLWMDEVYTFEDSRDDLRAQFNFYQENPTFLHPPLFFILTHQFYPFSKPERDLRMIPLLFGTLSIPMIYLLARFFSPQIALPCALSLTFMAYHISISQDGRSYSLLMFLGMASLFFMLTYLKTSKKWNLIFVAFFDALLFHTSYSSIPFIAFSQILLFYQKEEWPKVSRPFSFLILNSLIVLLCLPWLLLLGAHYKGQVMMDPFHKEDPGAFGQLLYGIFHDWVPLAPLMIASFALLLFFPLFSRSRKNAFVLLAVFILPIAGLYLFCRLLNVTHFISSRYFITFLPLFFISLFLSLFSMEAMCDRLKKYLRFRLLFTILFIASNLVILPLYYRSQKQDLRGLVSYLKIHLLENDNIFCETEGYMPGILHYFGAHPKGRHHAASSWRDAEGKVGLKIQFAFNHKVFSLFSSKSCCTQYVPNGNRLWIVVGKWTAKHLSQNSPFVLKGYFDGSFLNFTKFPEDASIYLFLWDPWNPNEKGIEMPIE